MTAVDESSGPIRIESTRLLIAANALTVLLAWVFDVLMHIAEHRILQKTAPLTVA